MTSFSALPRTEILSRPYCDIEQILFGLTCQMNMPGQAYLVAIALSVMDFRWDRNDSFFQKS